MRAIRFGMIAALGLTIACAWGASPAPAAPVHPSAIDGTAISDSSRLIEVRADAASAEAGAAVASAGDGVRAASAGAGADVALVLADGAGTGVGVPADGVDAGLGGI